MRARTAALLAAVSLVPACSPRPNPQPAADSSGIPAAPRLPTSPADIDLSGIAWVDDDRFLAVHDSKNPDENARPRISLVSLPTARAVVTRQGIALSWPEPLGLSSDLESIARVPGTPMFLLAESGEGMAAGRQFRRVFLVELLNDGVRLQGFADLPGAVRNIEGTAVARVGDQLTFLLAERAEGEAATDIAWMALQLQPLGFGTARSVRFRAEGMGRPGWRPVVALEVDDAGEVFAVSAYDPGSDDGPFQSVVWRVGRIESGSDGSAQLVLSAQPELLARLDGFKVEGLAARPGPGGATQLFVGTDDENFGGTLRAIR